MIGPICEGCVHFSQSAVTIYCNTNIAIEGSNTISVQIKWAAAGLRQGWIVISVNIYQAFASCEAF